VNKRIRDILNKTPVQCAIIIIVIEVTAFIPMPWALVYAFSLFYLEFIWFIASLILAFRQGGRDFEEYRRQNEALRPKRD
jgi:hypothetical protein